MVNAALFMEMELEKHMELEKGYSGLFHAVPHAKGSTADFAGHALPLATTILEEHHQLDHGEGINP